jgi:hypothetical protein
MRNREIRSLLDLSGAVLDQEDGYWIKVDAWEVIASQAIPHGIRYSLTLHEPSGQRILGYDNAHMVKPKGLKFSGRRWTYDHRHRFLRDTGVPYVFTDAHQLLADFFEEVDLVLKEVKPK